ncbi:hypothetical protein [Streptomyces sp. NPDC012508]|uniref:hypothetical protein n=1 Tax=Streptomyces sp. NPDC012508 TaxID=3364837 RepID=UPI0036801C56
MAGIESVLSELLARSHRLLALEMPAADADCSGCVEHGSDPDTVEKGMRHAQRFQSEA